MSESAFWEKVGKCKHENLHEYYHAWGSCPTPHCGGWDEYHCKDCGAYITECRCGVNNGISGWPHLRWKMREMVSRREMMNRAEWQIGESDWV